MKLIGPIKKLKRLKNKGKDFDNELFPVQFYFLQNIHKTGLLIFKEWLASNPAIL